MSKFSEFQNLKSEIQAVGKLLPYFGGMKKLLPLSFLLGVASSFIESVAVGLVVMFVFQSITQNGAALSEGGLFFFFDSMSAITKDNVAIIWAIIISSIALKSIVSGIYHLLSAHVINTIHHKIRSALFEKYMSLPYKDLAKLDYGEMTNTLQVECWYISEAIRAFSLIFIASCTIFVYLLILAILSWPLALLIVFCGVFIKLFSHLLYLPLKNIGLKVTEINEKLSLQMFTRLQALKSFRAHGLERQETEKFSLLSQSVALAFTNMSRIEIFLRPIYDVGILVTIALIIWCSSMMDNSAILTATIVAFLYRLQPHLYSLENAFMVLAKSYGPIRAVIKQLEAPDVREEISKNLPVPNNWQVLRFENISFSYDETRVLENINFELPRGKTLHIKGASGAGKSTLINLLLKLTMPTSGQIWLDETDFQAIGRSQWLPTITAAGQDFELLDGTILENITLGRHVDEKSLQQALEIAEIKDYIEQLPDGLQTKIGERGIRLSGGQRQRIIIARALCSNPDILILDEATSALGFDTEKEIYNHIQKHRPEITLVIITHRSLPKKFADIEVEL